MQRTELSLSMKPKAVGRRLLDEARVAPGLIAAFGGSVLGFTLTLITIHLMPYLVDWLGWHYAFVPLALGPAFGVWAMARLRAHPDATKLGKKFKLPLEYQAKADRASWAELQRFLGEVF